MLLSEQLGRIAEMHGGELPLPAGPGPGALNERNADAYLWLARDIAQAPGSVLPMGSVCSVGNDGNAVKFADPETGQLARDFYHNPVTGQTVNSIGLKQFGIREAVRILPEAEKIAQDVGKLLKVSVSTLGDEDASVVLPELMERVYEAVRNPQQVVVEANLGCPNKVEESGLRHPILGLDPEATAVVADAVDERLGKGLPRGYKLSYYEEETGQLTTGYPVLRSVLQVIAASEGADFVSLTNTEVGVRLKMPDGAYALDRIPGNAGGGGGPHYKEASYQQLLLARRGLPGHIDVVSLTGVWDGAEVRRRELGGAVLSEMVSRLWVEGERDDVTYGEVMKRVYREYIEARTLEEAASGSL